MGQLVSDVTKILDSKESKKNAESQRQKVLSEIAKDEAEKTNLIKKVLAQQRAKYGASGNASTGFSENAVLKRLRDETAQPYETKKQNNLDKISAIKSQKTNLVKTWLSRIDDIVG